MDFEEEETLVLNRSKHKRKAIVFSEEDEPIKKIKLDDSFDDYYG